MLITRLHAFFNPERFQGWGKKRNYFEGWYFKLVNRERSHAYAVIPGIAMDPQGNRHAFVQVLDGINKSAVYHRFSADEFKPARDKMEVRIGENLFSEQELYINLPGLKGHLHFSGNVPWPKPFYSPGIMGPYAFAPFMECYHGIVSMDHAITGSLENEKGTIPFDEGRGYMEKDWGRSFPSAYFWMQSNHFSRPGISLKCSVAKIPWVRKAFTGFIAGLWLENRLYRFTTYNGTRMIRSFADEDKVEIVLSNKNYLLEINARRDHSTELASPIRGFMEGRIEESMTAELQVKLTDNRKGTILFEDLGKNAGLEVAGRIQEIMT